MKKYLLLVLFCTSLSFASAQIEATEGSLVVKDKDDGVMTCTDLKYILKLRSKDASTNNEVSALQEFLQDNRFLDTDPSGYFGATTQKAVKAFQKQNGLLVSGLVGSFTRKAIKEKSCNQTKAIAPIKKEQPPTQPTQQPEAVACTMEYRACSDGSAMPREANCAWREDKCPVATSSSSYIPEVGTAEYTGFLNDRMFIKTVSISKSEAYDNCLLNHRNNQAKSIRCTWNGKEIYREEIAVSKKSVSDTENNAPSSHEGSPAQPSSSVEVDPRFSLGGKAPKVAVSAPAEGSWYAIGQSVPIKWETTNLSTILEMTQGNLWAGAYVENVLSGKATFLGDAMNFRGGETKRSIPLTSEGVTTVPGIYKALVYLYAQEGVVAKGYSAVFNITSADVSSAPTVLGAQTACVRITRNLHRGDKSGDTHALQVFLRSSGYLLDEPTGFYGDKTIEAVKGYQSTQNLPVTGMAFDFTRKAIARETCGE